VPPITGAEDATVKLLFAAGGMLMLSVLISSAPGMAQSDGNQAAIDAGRIVYMQNCASCHGAAAMGGGPAAAVLLKRPPDLTLYRRRTTPFPAQVIRRVITGHIRRVPPQLPIEMPVWRTSLERRVRSGSNLTAMDALLAYLESMQQHEFGPYTGPSLADIAAEGAALYKVHCTSCHGENGRGAGTTGLVVGFLPDLTTIASRHGGFELRGVYESIARHDAGNDDPMPSFARIFRQVSSEYVTMQKLEALATYVESIQR
jgi:mono/diheme cytochrome c family protein